MAKARRDVPVDAAMHIMCRGNNKLAVLSSDEDKVNCYFLLGKFKIENNIDILHYCIMNNHLHIIVWLNSQSNVSRFMKQFSLAYFQCYRRRYGYYGHLWQGRFKSVIIEEDTHALQCGKYIELNPVKAGIVKTPEQYRFSSYGYYSKSSPDQLITANPAYEGLSNSPKERQLYYINFVKEGSLENE
ncbi:MAG: transposase [Candidatus Omnitrophota bacterium]|jgi:putative transposase|nr:transposase [Candidatus Omnitrophota bacterium]